MGHAPSIDEVKAFWEQNPLFDGETEHELGSRAYFDEHRQVVIDDCFAGELDERLFPKPSNDAMVLDVGCGPGMWSIELALRRCGQIHACDLTERAIGLAIRRAKAYGFEIKFSRENAEALSYANDVFDHINCIGVIHHTPNTEKCISEFARILKPRGTATIGVYHMNLFLRSWRTIHPLGKIAAKLGARMKGRDRETIYSIKNREELIKAFDGTGNPIGKAYTRGEFATLLREHFQIENIFLHHFPARSLPFGIPRSLHRFLDRNFGFMVYAKVARK